MKDININRKKIRNHRHQRILKRVRQSNEHLRARVTKTNAHIYVQVLDDSANKVVYSASSLQLKLPNGNKANATKVGEALAAKLNAANIKQVSFDRGGSKYHGRVAAITEALRANKIKV